MSENETFLPKPFALPEKYGKSATSIDYMLREIILAIASPKDEDLVSRIQNAQWLSYSCLRLLNHTSQHLDHLIEIQKRLAEVQQEQSESSH